MHIPRLTPSLQAVVELLGSHFVRISKSALINFRRMHHAEASFNGTMEIVMQNGMEEIITRSYRREFKEHLGL